MADLVRVSGTRIVTPTGSTTISSVRGSITLASTSTNLTGSANIAQDTNIYGNIQVQGSENTVIIRADDGNVNNQLGIAYDPNNAYGTRAQRLSAAVYVAGGVGIEKDLNVGGYIYGRVSQANTSLQLLVTSTNVNSIFYPLFSEIPNGGSHVYSDIVGAQGGLTYNPSSGTMTIGRINVASTDTSFSSTSGSVTIAGGVGIGGNMYVGDITPNDANNLGSVDAHWATGYVDNLYSSILASTTGSVQISPADNLLQVNADIRVMGNKPIGTAPVVTNVLYVTMDGNDINDGRAMDSSRACRTLGGALKSPYYQPGTQIRVSPGRYLEDNPLQLKPYTSIVGSDIRTTSIEPINKTQDLFHMNSGCYLAFMQFLNGRSGLLAGPYAAEFNRGAYCTAFPPLSGDNRIDVFHSPYIQNCTNLTGPWLVDGTLFTPDQTVQVPTAVGTGTWVANTSSIVVTVSTGTISVGMSVNPGQQNLGFFNARTLMLANKAFMQEQVVAYVNKNFPGFSYNQEKCYRDVGILVENISYDAAFGGNQKAIESGLAYYNGVVSLIFGQEMQTSAAITYLSSLAQFIIANTAAPDLLSDGTNTTAINSQVVNIVLTDGAVAATSYTNLFSIVTSIINGGPSAAPQMYVGSGPDAAYMSAEILMQANRTFIQQDTLAYVNTIAQATGFVYDQSKCYRDVGLIIDAVSQDILLGGNQKSIEAGLGYWSAGYNYVAGQESTTTNAILHARDIALRVIANQAVTPQVGNTSTQVINTFFRYGGDYMPQQAVRRNFGIITDIITLGPNNAPPVYQGGGLFALTGINGLDVKISPSVTSVSSIGANKYLVGLDTPTVGFGDKATLYFGNTLVFPMQDAEVEAMSLQYTGSTSTWNSRKIDPIGGMGGSLVDGNVVSDRSPIQSFVYDAFTQLTQGGRGIHITNNGYAQLVSVFTIFSSVGVQCDNGGIASIVNSNANFGDLCLVSKGYGKRKFSGTIYNPPFKAYPHSAGDNGYDQYYPNGFWPNNAQIEVFLPDTNDRPHTSLIMEIIPPTEYIDFFDINYNTFIAGGSSVGAVKPYLNDQQLPGFLNAQPTLASLSTGTITITGIDTSGIAIGNSVYIRDQRGSYTDVNGIQYAATGTVVTDLGYQSVTLNYALTSGGSDPSYPENANWFTLLFCGNSYYTVLSSTVADNPYTTGTNIISAATFGISTSQVSAHIDSLNHLRDLIGNVVSNTAVSPVLSTSTQQFKMSNSISAQDLPAVISVINGLFSNMTSIIGASDINAANAVVPTNSIVKSATLVSSMGDAVSLIESNIDFLVNELDAYVRTSNPGLAYNKIKCRRDVGIVLQRLIYDLESGGNYNSVMVGLSYWSRNGTHHIVQLEEDIRRPDFFPDGCTINFYQRSYMNASGYVFEYVGAGTNYGALPQYGRADPVQSKETLQLGGGKVFFTSTDQNGDFRIGPELVISQATGVVSGRTFTKSLFANLTPFILAIESGGL